MLETLQLLQGKVWPGRAELQGVKKMGRRLGNQPRQRFPQQCKKCFSGSAGKESSCNAGDLGSIPGLGRSPGEGKGYPLQNSGLENSVDCIVHGVSKSWTGLSDFHWKCYWNLFTISSSKIEETLWAISEAFYIQSSHFTKCNSGVLGVLTYT